MAEDGSRSVVLSCHLLFLDPDFLPHLDTSQNKKKCFFDVIKPSHLLQFSIGVDFSSPNSCSFHIAVSDVSFCTSVGFLVLGRW